MLFLAELIVLCGLFFFICYSHTGTDEKNMKSYSVYPDEVKEMIQKDPTLSKQIKVTSTTVTFISNLLVFGVILFVFGLPLKTENFQVNFLTLLFLGQLVNAFDFFVVDCMWWRHSPRIRFSQLPNEASYQDVRYHRGSFFRGILLFIAIAVIDGILITMM